MGYSDSNASITYDVDLAKKLMKEAGVDKIETVLPFPNRPEDIQNAQFYKGMLAKIGIDVKVEPIERVAWAKLMQSGDFDMTSFLSGTRVDPDLVLGFRYLKGGGGNYVAWDNSDMQECMKEGREEYDAAKRQTIYQRCEGIVVDDAYIDWTWRRQVVRVINKHVQGWVDSWDWPKLTTWWLDS